MQAGEHLGGDGAGDQGGGAGDDAVQDDRDAQGRGAQHAAGDGGVLQAADRREHPDRVGGVGLVELQRAADDLHLAGVHLVVDAGAAPGDLRGVARR